MKNKVLKDTKYLTLYIYIYICIYCNFYCKDGQTVEQVAQNLWRVYICGEIQNLTGPCPGQLALAASAWAGVLD